VLDGDRASVTFELEKRGSLILHVTPPPDGEMKLALRFQRRTDREPVVRELEEKDNVTLRTDGTIEIRNVSAGTYQLGDDLSGALGAVATLEAGARADLHLGLSRAAWLDGRVEVPENAPREGIVILAQPLGVRYGDVLPDWGRAAVTGPDGRFRVRVTPSTAALRPWHALLWPADQGGTATMPVTGELVLRLERGNTLPMRVLAPLEHAERLGSFRIELYRDAPGSDQRSFTSWVHVGSDHLATLGGFEPGTYTAWLDPSWLAPVRLEGLELHAGENPLVEVHFDEGSAILVKPRSRSGIIPPLQIDARSLSQPSYFRQRAATSGEPLRVTGLSAGAFEITVRRALRAGSLLQQRIEVDGKNDVTIEVEIP
jgi:hypothetical protein